MSITPIVIPPTIAYMTECMSDPYVLNPKIFTNFSITKQPEISNSNIVIGFLNVRRDRGIDKPNNIQNSRILAIPQIIETKGIDILGFCEMTPKQLQTLVPALDNKYNIIGFCRGKLNDKYNTLIDDITEKHDNYDEIVGMIYDVTRFELCNDRESLTCHRLPNSTEGQKHPRIFVTGRFRLISKQQENEINDDTNEISVTVFHFDNLSKESRLESCKIVNEHLRNENKIVYDLTIACGDGNLFEDEQGSEMAKKIYENGIKDPRYVSKFGHYGQEGTIIGGNDWDKKFLPQIRVDQNTNINYFDSNCIDLMCYVSDRYTPKFTMNFPVYMTDKIEFINSCIVPQEKIESRKNAASDHLAIMTVFEKIYID